MTIVPMRKMTLCGPVGEKPAALAALQALGAVHLIPLRTGDPLAPADATRRRSAENAMRHIREAAVQRRPYPKTMPFDLDAVIAEITANRKKQRQLADRHDEITAHIGALTPWGDFALPALDDLAGQRLWFYEIGVKDRAALNTLELPWAMVGRDRTMLRVVVISSEEPPANLLPVPRAHVGARRLRELEDELEQLEIDIERCDADRAELTRWRQFLSAEFAKAQDRDALAEAGGQALDTGEFFVVQGWIPADAVPGVEALALGSGHALVLEPPSADDKPPTLLRVDAPSLESGSDLTNFYTSPGYNSWDPSIVVFWSFAIFFAMIMADAGYALLIAVVIAFYWTRMGKSPGGRRTRALLTAITGACLVYGVAAGSYFGVVPKEGSFLRRIAFIDVTNFDVMMRVSVLIGAAHISIALGTVAWHNRGTGKSIASMGWIAVIAGGLLLWLGSHWLKSLGTLVLVAGFVAAFWGNACERPIKKPTDWLLRGFDGFLGLTGITKLFGDILSYLRLFALGLASASLAGTFNHMAGNIETTRPGVGLLISLIILLFGHSINFVIGIMGGVVHGLRLNYIEFFGWGLAEEGYPFRAFAKKEASE